MKEEKIWKVLCDRAVFVSFSEAKRACMKGQVKINNEAVNNPDAMASGDHVSVDRKFSKCVNLDGDKK